MKAVPQYWLVKQEPTAYSWADLVGDKRCAWTGVRNFQARNNLRAMNKGDGVLFYHSVEEKRVVGIATVVAVAYKDPTSDDGDWSCVDIAAKTSLKRPVTLAEIKAHPSLREIALVKNSRLSVSPLSREAFDEIVRMGT